MSLTDKYRPEKPDDVYGHNKAIKEIKTWAIEWERGEDPIFLHGSAGTGKTSTAESIANFAGWDIVEINASEERTKEEIDGIVQEIRTNYKDNTLFLFDEVDSINGNALQSLYKIIPESPNPIIFTANEHWKVPDGIKNKCEKYKFSLRKNSVKKFLREVCKKEDIDISSRQLGQLATRNGIRDALNDLEKYKETGETDWDERDTDDSPFAVTKRVIQQNNYLGDMSPGDMVEFLNENVKNEFDGVELMRSYQALSEADKFLGKTRRTQDYSWWYHAGQISEEVSNLRLTEPFKDWLNVDYPETRRNYTPHANSDSKEAQLYRELVDYEGTDFVAGFSFEEFRQMILPFIQKLPEEEKRELAITHNLSDNVVEILGLEEEYNIEVIEEEKGSEEQSSIFDY